MTLVHGSIGAEDHPAGAGGRSSSVALIFIWFEYDFARQACALHRPVMTPFT